MLRQLPEALGSSTSDDGLQSLQLQRIFTTSRTSTPATLAASPRALPLSHCPSKEEESNHQDLEDPKGLPPTTAKAKKRISRKTMTTKLPSSDNDITGPGAPKAHTILSQGGLAGLATPIIWRNRKKKSSSTSARVPNSQQ